MRREVTRESRLLGLVMALCCIVVLFAGEHVMRLLYHGKEYEGNGHTVTVLVLAMLAGGVGMPAFNALASVERARESFWIGAFGGILTVALVWCLVPGWGLLGAAYGFLAARDPGGGEVGRFLALCRATARKRI